MLSVLVHSAIEKLKFAVVGFVLLNTIVVAGVNGALPFVFRVAAFDDFTICLGVLGNYRSVSYQAATWPLS